jgi:putative colanic acid biosysnthesis UDP-glucose lipid carrier transferase
MNKNSSISLKKRGVFDEYARLISILQKLMDGGIVVLLLIFTATFFGFRFDYHYVTLAVTTFFLTLMVFQGAGLYRPWRGVEFLRLVRRLCFAWIVVVGLVVGLGFLTKTSTMFSRMVIGSWILLVPSVQLGLRLLVDLGLKWLRARGSNSRTVVIAGAGDLGQRLGRNIIKSPWLGMRLIGFFDDYLTDTTVRLEPGGAAYPNLGNLDNMLDHVKEHNIDMVYLALPMRAEERLRQAVEGLQDTTVSVYFAPDIFIFSLLGACLTDLRGVPLISLWESPFYGVNSWLKRAEDLFLASLFLLACCPLMLIIALGVKFSSPGPVFFKQRRYGLDGKEILIYKFRTMKVCGDGSENFLLTKRNDPRVTRFGAFLRRTSLDELPQLFNVLQGSMSIIGPRPHPEGHHERFRQHVPLYMLRHKIKPGLTGWAQVNGLRGVGMDELEKMEGRVTYDLEYLTNWSLWLDIKILFQTVLIIFRDPNAY